VRLNHDGSLDTSFGMGGKVVESRNLLYINAIAVQPTGKILISGVSGYGTNPRQFVVERFNADGTPDMTFGTMGVAGGAIVAGQDAMSMNMAIAPDGTIVLVGQTATSGGAQFGILELTPDGAPNTSFGGTGAVATTFAMQSYSLATHVAVQPDGGVLVLGSSGSALVLVRFTAAGVQDAVFGTKTLPTIPQGQLPFALALQPDGAIVAVGGNFLTGDLRVVRYSASGAPDGSFGSGGVYTRTLRPNDYYGNYSFYGLTVLPDGKLLLGLASASADGLTQTGTLLRLGADGQTDTSYGPDGTAAIAIGRGSTSVNALALDADGKLVVAGRVWTETAGSDYMILRINL
jgi:uncharacterized delta-60 repeat protein